MNADSAGREQIACLWRVSLPRSLVSPQADCGLRGAKYLPVVALFGFHISAALVHVGGTVRHAKYRLLQAFQGGSAFVVWQAASWTLLGISLLAQEILVSLPSAQVASWGFPMPLSVAGAGAFVAHCALLVSLEKFSATPLSRARVWPSRSRVPGRRTALYVALVSFGMYALVDALIARWLLFDTADSARLASQQRALAIVLSSAAATAALGVCLVHCRIGPRLSPAWRIVQPLAGGLRFCVLQGTGWTLAALGFTASVACLWIGVNKSLGGVVSGIGFIVFMAQILLIISLSYFDPDLASPHAVSAADPGRETELRYTLASLITSLGVFAVFSAVDYAIIRYGLHFPSAASMFSLCGIVAACASVPLTALLSPPPYPSATSEDTAGGSSGAVMSARTARAVARAASEVGTEGARDTCTGKGQAGEGGGTVAWGWLRGVLRYEDRSAGI